MSNQLSKMLLIGLEFDHKVVEAKFVVKGSSGENNRRATPVPIPNTEVKPSSAESTNLETNWEERKSPDTY